MDLVGGDAQIFPARLLTLLYFSNESSPELVNISLVERLSNSTALSDDCPSVRQLRHNSVET